MRAGKHLWNALAGIALTVLLTGCAQVAPITLPIGKPKDEQTSGKAEAALVATPTTQAAQVAGVRVTPTATPVSTSTSPTAPTSTVRRDTIVQAIQLNGRVTGTDETALAFSKRSTPSKVSVKPGDAVTLGQILVEADSTDLQKALKDVRDQIESAKAELTEAQRQAADKQREEATQQQAAEATAADALRKAKADYATLEAGASAIEKQAADADVINAQVAMQKAETELSKIKAGAPKADVANAEQQVKAAQLALRQAQADAAVVTGGPDPAQLRLAERELADARAAQVTAEAELDRLTHGPDSFDLRAAQREVDRAQAVLNAANAPASASGITGADRQAAITSAQLGLQDAQDKLARLQQPPAPDQLIVANTRVDSAKAAVATAQDKLDAVRKGPDRLAIDKAKAAVEAAQAPLDQAQAKLAQLKAGASDDELQVAAGVFKAAQLNLAIAQAKRDDVYNRPLPSELQDAQARIDAAQEALDRIRRAQSVKPAANDSAAQRNVQKAQDQALQLQADLEATRLRAPFDGHVVAVPAAQGVAIDADKAAVIIARSGDPFVVVTLPATAPAQLQARSSDQALVPADQALYARVSVGQKALIQIDGGNPTQLSGVVTNIVDAPAPSAMGDAVDSPAVGARTAQIQVDWESTSPRWGATSVAQIVVQQKQNALLVPAAAVHSAGGSKYVEIVDGDTRKLQPIDTGIVSATDIEVLGGLSEGQVVIGKSQSATTAAIAPLANGSLTAATPPTGTDAGRAGAD